jgi:hypothetical protein
VLQKCDKLIRTWVRVGTVLRIIPGFGEYIADGNTKPNVKSQETHIKMPRKA